MIFSNTTISIVIVIIFWSKQCSVPKPIQSMLHRSFGAQPGDLGSEHLQIAWVLQRAEGKGFERWGRLRAWMRLSTPVFASQSLGITASCCWLVTTAITSAIQFFQRSCIFFRLHFSFIEKKCNALFYDRYYLGPINHVSITQHCARKCNKWTHLTNSSNCNGLLLGVTRKQVLLESDTAHAVEPRLWFRPDSLPDIGGLWLRNL